MYIIGIGGGTGSGKTTVVRKILETLPAGRVALIPQDSYYNDTTHLTMEERRRINFDHPNAFDWALLIEQIQRLRQGLSIEQPTYSYIISNRLEETVHVEPCEVIIIEGIMALWRKELRDLMDLKIYVDADPDERLIRVIQRDTVERGRTTQMVIDRYRDVLKPMHEEFIEPTKRYADLIIPQGGNNSGAIEIMRTYIIHRLKPESLSPDHP
ncbi:MAG: uridine kinase [Bacteroidaceae bacterium]|jgi:uridine kinase|nr:uridine kinase [Bacteroidaceae bacterium]